MGITGLWSLLEPVKEDITFSKCKGKRIAVDLSGWIVSCALISSESLTKSGGTPKSFLVHRGIFFRALNLSKLGIILVFIIDGPEAPTRKGKHSRQAFFQESLQYKSLLTAMGFLVLEARGEAEKMCAELNQQNLVDGVLTSDGDAIVYGAQVVYKGMFAEKKEQKACMYTMTKIKSDLRLNYRDLVTFALLSKGDISDGVSSVGEKKFLELMTEFKQNAVQDSLQRLKSWRSNSDLNALEEKQNLLSSMTKSAHCSVCLHEGPKNVHSKTGCSVCKSTIGCCPVPPKPADRAHSLCPCGYCTTQTAVKSHTHELKIRHLALKQDQSFPLDEVMDEYLIPHNNLPELEKIQMREPNFLNIYKILREKLHFSPMETAKHLIPWTIKMALNGILPTALAKPLRIIKTCKENFEECYQVEWARLDLDVLYDDTSSCYTFNVASSLFDLQYPDMSKQFKLQNSSQRGGKRKSKPDPNQPKISEMFKIRKSMSTGEKLPCRMAQPSTSLEATATAKPP